MIDREKHPILTDSDIEDLLKALKPMEMETLESKVMGFSTRKEAQEQFQQAINDIDISINNLEGVKNELQAVDSETVSDVESAIDALEDTKSILQEWLRTSH